MGAAIVDRILEFLFLKGRAKYTMIALGVAVLMGAVWYLTNQYESIKLENTKLEIANKTFAENEIALFANIKELSTQYSEQIKEQNNAAVMVQELQHKILTVSEERKKDNEVFNRKSKTFQDMLNRRGKTIIKLANTGSSRVRLKWTKNVNEISDSLQKGANSMLTSPRNSQIEP